MKVRIPHGLFCLIVIVFQFLNSFQAAAQIREPLAMFSEVADYTRNRTKELVGQGKRVDSDKRQDLENEKKALAKTYAAELASRSNNSGVDFYYLGMLYYMAGNDPKAVETLKRFLSSYPVETNGEAIQSARSYVIVLSARQKQFADAEQTYEAWLKGKPRVSERPAIEKSLAVSLYKDGRYDEAIKYGESAFSILKTTAAPTLAERRAKMELYSDLVEILALSYRKAKRTDDALNVLAETRALSFTIPSATLYRSVMDIVQGSGFSEKRLMQKVESYEKAPPAAELTIEEWLGQEPVTLEALRGNVVLLDFWATWCGPCISTFPRLRDWHKKYSSKGLKIIGVTQFYGEADGKRMTQLQEMEFLGEFKRKYKLPYGFAISKRGEANAKFDINAYPTTILLDRNGVVRYIGIGAGMEESENLEEMIKKLTSDEQLATR